MSTYAQLAPKYDAHQWTSGMSASDFSAIVDPLDTLDWTVNADGSLHFERFPLGPGDIQLNEWVVSTAYWTATMAWDFANTTTFSPRGTMSFSNAEFNGRFTLAS